MKKYAYKLLEYPKYVNSNSKEENFLIEMNRLGEDGWELVTIIPPTEDQYQIAYFKR